MHRVLMRLWLGIVFVTAGCGGSSTPAGPTKVKNVSPTVSVAFQGASSCSPPAGGDCTLQVAAQAIDADGDPLSYAWTGCASGTGAGAVCTIRAAGAVTATVTVSDGHGHTVTASAAGEGTAIPNAPPTVTVSFDGSSHCVPSPDKPCTVKVIAHANDPESDELTYSWSGCAKGTAASATCSVQRPVQSRLRSA